MRKKGEINLKKYNRDKLIRKKYIDEEISWKNKTKNEEINLKKNKNKKQWWILQQFIEMEYSVFLRITFIFLIQICLNFDSLLFTVYQFDIWK